VIQVCIVALALVTMIVMSIRANERFADTRRLPMQWSVSGAVTWTAPRLFALAFTPSGSGYPSGDCDRLRYFDTATGSGIVCRSGGRHYIIGLRGDARTAPVAHRQDAEAERPLTIKQTVA
jgi:hypothetical protein